LSGNRAIATIGFIGIAWANKLSPEPSAHSMLTCRRRKKLFPENDRKALDAAREFFAVGKTSSGLAKRHHARSSKAPFG
jgi:hypothetical protein